MKVVHLLFSVCVALGAVLPACPAEIMVFAAASLSDALKEISPLYTQATGDTLRLNFGASGTFVRQIKEGAPADVIFSADELRIDQLEKAGLLLPGTRRTVLVNSLVVVVRATHGASVRVIGDLADPDVRLVAIGEPATVPVGSYAKQYLQKTGDWEALIDKMVPLDNVRAVLSAVAFGNVEAGFVYKTDALVASKVKIAFEVPLDEGPRIRYPVAVVKDTKRPVEAARLVEFLAGAAAQEVFARFGFLPAN